MRHGHGPFYLDFLDFELVFEHRFGEGLLLYMGLRKGDCGLHLSEHYGDVSPGAALRIPIDNVTVYAAALRGKNFGNARPSVPEPTPWGSREITITDVILRAIG